MAHVLWCPGYPLETVDLTGVFVQGCYIIWHSGSPARVVRVGQGDVSARLSAHRRDPVAYRRFGTLYAKWASVNPLDRDGVEAHLSRK